MTYPYAHLPVHVRVQRFRGGRTDVLIHCEKRLFNDVRKRITDYAVDAAYSLSDRDTLILNVAVIEKAKHVQLLDLGYVHWYIHRRKTWWQRFKEKWLTAA